MSILHATAVRLNGKGILIRGPSGSGKSRLAMALLEPELPAEQVKLVTDQLPVAPPLATGVPTALIGDDYLHLRAAGAQVEASPAKGLEGLIEVRGLGILAMPWCPDAPIHLAVDLTPLEQMARLPDGVTTQVLDQEVSRINVPVSDLAHQVLLVRLALKTLPVEG